MVHDPVDFLHRLAKQDRTAARNNGNVVLAAAAPTATDFGLCVQIAAAFAGAFFASPEDFAGQDAPRGMLYKEKLRSSTRTDHVAVTASLQEDFPTLPQLFRILAQSPSGCVRLYLGLKERCKTFKKNSKAARKQACVLCRLAEEKDAAVQQPPEVVAGFRRVS